MANDDELMEVPAGALFVLPIHGISGTSVLLCATVVAGLGFAGESVVGVAQPRQLAEDESSTPMKPGMEPELEAVDVQ